MMSIHDLKNGLFNLERIPMLLIHVDTAAIEDCNQAACSFYGYSYDEMVQKKFGDLNGLTDVRSKPDNRTDYFRQNKTHLEWHQRANGERCAVEVHFTPLVLEGRSYVFAIAESRLQDRSAVQEESESLPGLMDNAGGLEELNARLEEEIEERIHSEEALQRELAFNKALIENMADGAIACDAEGTFTLFNAVAREWHGLDIAELSNRETFVNEFLFPEDSQIPVSREYTPLTRALQGKKIQNERLRIVSKDQPERKISVNGGPFFDDQGKKLGAVVVMRDITKQLAEEQELLRLNSHLEGLVYERTLQLEEMNAGLEEFNALLQDEIIERKKAEEMITQLNNELEYKVLLRTHQLEEQNVLLDNSNRLLEAILESSPQVLIYTLDRRYRYLAFNQQHQAVMQYLCNQKVEVGVSIWDYIGEGEYPVKLKHRYDRALAGEDFSVTEEHTDKEQVRNFWQAYYSPILDQNGQVVGLTCFSTNISDLVRTERHLNETKAILQASLDHSPAGIVIVNATGSELRYINKTGRSILNQAGNVTFEGLGINASNINKNAFFHLDGTPYEIGEDPLSRAILNGETCSEESIIRQEGFEDKVIWSNAAPIRDEMGRIKAGIVVFLDITNRKKAEEEILYLSYHDKLTGLYNRRFCEEEIKRLDTERNLPLTIIMGDVNGLKLVNDAFGHDQGDELLRKAAALIQDACRSDDIVARWGGDEIVIILPRTKGEEAEEIVRRIKDLCTGEQVNNLSMSISFGWDTKQKAGQDIIKILKSAEDFMYKHKIVENADSRGNAIKTIINTLHEKNQREEQHSKRVSALCQVIGQKMRFSDIEVNRLRVVGLLHDIGKIAVEESILNKTELLSRQEWVKIKRHPEIGYRILNSSNDMLDLADIILAHHEHWDGSGYPKGLKGTEIPEISRIVALADSYDAMTSYRTYRKALSDEEACEEILRYAGTQFDPDIARIFIEEVLKKPDN